MQRDALTTRGIQGKAPFSNRNFRWHNLIVAEKETAIAKKITRIDIENNTLVFVIKDKKGKEINYPADKVHELAERYVVLPEHWQPHINTLKNWGDVEWTQNSAIITAYESCDWIDAVEAYAILGIAVLVAIYEVDFEIIYPKISEILSKQTIDKNISLPSKDFPKDLHDIISCPLCKVSISENPAHLPERKREQRWKPAWSDNKRGEGEDGSIQIMHINPLTETKINHNGKNVRFGHRWCNVAMTDHSIMETIDFMTFIVQAHNNI